MRALSVPRREGPVVFVSPDRTCSSAWRGRRCLFVRQYRRPRSRVHSRCLPRKPASSLSTAAARKSAMNANDSSSFSRPRRFLYLTSHRYRQEISHRAWDCRRHRAAFRVGWAEMRGASSAISSRQEIQRQGDSRCGSGQEPQDSKTPTGRNERSRLIDKFRNRIMFPMADTGRVVGSPANFGEGFASSNISILPKRRFHKSRILYGLVEPARYQNIISRF